MQIYIGTVLINKYHSIYSITWRGQLGEVMRATETPTIIQHWRVT